MADKDLPGDQEVAFHYLKSNHFRVVHVDGAVGGLTPQRNITVSLFNERPAIPQQTFHKIKPDGSLGDELIEKKITRKGIVREVEVDLVFSLDVAERLHRWLGTMIGNIRSQNKDAS